MVVQVNPSDFNPIFNDFVKSGKVMFNFLCDGEILDIQLLEEFTVTTTISCRYISGTKELFQDSYYVASPIHILNSEESIFIDFSEMTAIITQGNFQYTLLKEFEARKDLPYVEDGLFMPLNAGRLQYLTITADKMVTISKELKTLPVEPMFVNGHFYNRYSNIAFIDEFDICTDICIPFEVLKRISSQLGAKSRYAIIDGGEQIVIKSKRYTYYILAVNFNLKGNNVAALDSMILNSRKVATICFTGIKDIVQLLLSTLQNQRFSFSAKEDKFCLSITSADSTASMFLGEKINNPDVSMFLTPGRMNTIMKIFGEDEKVDVYVGSNIMRFCSGTKNLILSGLVY